MATATVEIVDVDTTVAATYTSGIQVKIKDKNGNEAVSKNDVVIFDDKNTTPPTLAAKAEYRTIKLEEDANKINWANDFIESAVDKDGIVLNSRVEADLSELDTTTAGTYNVPLTVTDYANNKASITIEVEVVKGE